MITSSDFLHKKVMNTTNNSTATMKRKFFIAGMMIALIAVCLFSAPYALGQAVIEFEKKTHDFGTIKAEGGIVKCEYKFVNKGTSPLIILSVSNGGCGCTEPSFSKAPIKPGKSGVVKIAFNPSGRRGEFNREVKVKTNGTPKRLFLKFKGVIVP